MTFNDYSFHLFQFLLPIHFSIYPLFASRALSLSLSLSLNGVYKITFGPDFETRNFVLKIHKHAGKLQCMRHAHRCNFCYFLMILLYLAPHRLFRLDAVKRKKKKDASIGIFFKTTFITKNVYIRRIYASFRREKFRSYCSLSILYRLENKSVLQY